MPHGNDSHHAAYGIQRTPRDQTSLDDNIPELETITSEPQSNNSGKKWRAAAQTDGLKRKT